MPLELRALALLLLLDVGFGIWLSIHVPSAVSLFLAQLPAVGFGGAIWGILPDETKDKFGRWTAGILSSGRFMRVLLILCCAGLVATFCYTTVRVEAVVPDMATRIALVHGTQSDLQQRGAPIPDQRLNRLTTPVLLPVWFPLRRHVWLYTPTHVSAANLTVWPWLQAKVQYPDDFEPLITIAVLPGTRFVEDLHGPERAVFTLLDEDGRSVIATDTMRDARGALISFTQTGLPDTLRWHNDLFAQFPDSASIETRDLFMKNWTNPRWVQSRRPLRTDDSVVWKVHWLPAGRRDSGSVRLKPSVTDLHLEF